MQPAADTGLHLFAVDKAEGVGKLENLGIECGSEGRAGRKTDIRQVDLDVDGLRAAAIDLEPRPIDAVAPVEAVVTVDPCLALGIRDAEGALEIDAETDVYRGAGFLECNIGVGATDQVSADIQRQTIGQIGCGSRRLCKGEP